MAAGFEPREARPGGSIVVLAVIANESVSGPGRQLASFASAAARHGVRLHVAILHRRGNPRPPFADYLAKLGVPFSLLDDNGPVDLAIARRLNSLVEDLAPDILQTHGYKATAAGLIMRRFRRRIPWVGFFHGETHEDLKARFYHWLDHRMLGAADAVVVMSALQRQSFARLGHKVRVIYNAVLPDPPVVGPDDGDRIADLLHGFDRPLLGVVGRLSPEKGVDLLLDACGALRRSGYGFSLVVAGDGPDHAALEQQAARLGIDQRVTFLGSVRNVGSLYSAIDVLVIPSRSEGLPNVLLEALAADLPVVSTRVGAVPEVLTDPAAGVILDHMDGDSLRRAIDEALRLRSSDLGIRARAETALAFSVEARIRRHLDLYVDVSGGAMSSGTERGGARSARQDTGGNE
jgi:glycosyltransferase involved in cell wall biosynthesis